MHVQWCAQKVISNFVFELKNVTLIKAIICKVAVKGIPWEYICHGKHIML